MGSLGKFVDGKSVVVKTAFRQSWDDSKPRYNLDDCPKCGTKQGERRADLMISMSYAGTRPEGADHDYSKWFIWCRNCGYYIMSNSEEEVKKQWNCEFLF